MRRFLAFLLLFPLAAAQVFEGYHIDVDIGDSVTQSVTLNLTNNAQIPIDSVTFILPKNPTVLGTEGGNYIAKETERGTEVKLIPPERIKPGAAGYAGVEFQANDLVEKSGKNEVFKISLVAAADIEDFSLLVRLPKGGNAVLENGKPLASPPPSLGTDGERITLRWKQPLKAGETFSAIAFFHRTQNDWMYLIAILVAAPAAIFLYFRNRAVKIVEISLDEDEKKIFEYIREKNEVTQDEVTDYTKFSKTKVSKLVRRLEERKFITKEPYKKTNRLKLSKAIT